jgi:hypothetical protein
MFSIFQKLVCCIAFCILAWQGAKAQGIVSNKYYRLSCQWQGVGKPLEVKDNLPQLIPKGDFTEQIWKITDTGNGFYRLTNLAEGEEKSLDIINDGKNDQPKLTKTGNFSGQSWKFTRLENGFYRITNQWQGEQKSLDVVNSGNNDKVKLATTGNFSGQYWELTEVKTLPTQRRLNYPVLYRHGFKIVLDAETDTLKQPFAQKALQDLTKKLQEITQLLPASKVKNLQKVSFYIYHELLKDKAAWYVSAEKRIEIVNAKNFVEWQALNQPFMVLHELAHGFHDICLSEQQKKLVTTTFQQATQSKKYESVPYGLGGKKKAYAIENEFEYFAEMTEAYWGKNDYYPYTRKDLQEFDTKGFELMEAVWK